MGAKNAEATSRVSALAEHRSAHSDYHQGRSPYTEVTPGAKSAKASARLEQLATQKAHKTWGCDADIEYRNAHYAKPITEVSPNAMHGSFPAHVETLAAPKGYHPSFQGAKPVRWIVSDEAKNASASDRVQQLGIVLLTRKLFIKFFI